ncbi:MAG: hypothetical protein HFI09_02005, partial [Bacilli bacterium]|nr:hypothetical protein [Bacilli bacterium]
MQKHDIFRLYVVKTSTKGNDPYLICSKGILSGEYIEILTKAKVNIKDESCVTSLVDYYSPLAVTNYSTGKHLMLTRDDILKMTILINMNYAITTYDNEMDKKIDDNYVERLEEATKKLFSGDGHWSSAEYSRPEDSLIGHLRDDKWLTYKLRECGLEDIFFGTLLNYVKTSKVFKAERDAYEQRIVKWQIGWMVNGGDAWLVPEEFGGDFIRFNKNCDIGFRKGILRTLEAIGMDTDAIERGIEENVDLWREREMLSAFRNNYEPILGFVNKKRNDMKPTNEEHKNAWIKLRL